MWRRTLLAVVALVITGCGAKIDPAKLAQHVWQLDDTTGTLQEFRDVFPQAQPRCTEFRQRYQLNLRPDYIWSVEAVLPSGHRLRVERRIPREAIATDTMTIERAEPPTYELCSPVSQTRHERRELNDDEFRAVVAARGDAATLREAVADLDLDLPPLDESALDAHLRDSQPWFDRLRQAFPDLRVKFTRDPFSRRGRVSAYVPLGDPVDEHELSEFVLSRDAPCVFAHDGKSIDVFPSDALSDRSERSPNRQLRWHSTYWITGGNGQKMAMHDTLDVWLSEVQFDEIVAHRGDKALLDRLVKDERQRQEKSADKPGRKTVQP